MKKIFKFAFKNIIRFPARTLLYFAIVFVTVVTVLVCYALQNAGEAAAVRFREDYAAVATVIPRETPDGSISVKLYLNDLEKLRMSDTVVAYGLSVSAEKTAFSEIVHSLPTDEILEREPASFIESRRYSVSGVSNIMLTEQFFCGDSVLTDGEYFNTEDMNLGNNVIIISAEAAEYYGLKVGDSITLNAYERINAYVSYTVKGIYESKAGYGHCFVPFSSLLKLDSAVILSAIADPENNGYNGLRYYSFSRMDFLLDSVDSGRKFIEDAIDNGLDVDLYDIVINDRPYKIAVNGINTLCNVSAVVFFSVLVAGAALVVLITVLYASVRQKEKQILRALGMKRHAIGAMMLVETVVIISVSVALGIAASFPASRIAIRLADEKQTSDTATEASWSIIDPFDPSPEITLNRDMDFSLIDSKNTSIKEYIIPYARPVCGSDEVAYRFEKLWTPEGEELMLVGATYSAELGFANEASYDDEHKNEFLLKMDMPFKCYASKTSGYKVGDTVRLCTFSPMNIARLSGDTYRNYVMTYVTLQVAGTFTQDVGGDILMPMEEMELMCDCAYVHTEGYRNDRYDKVVKK